MCSSDLRDWLHSLHELSEIKIQKQWINSETASPHYCFTEFYECYFDLVCNYEKHIYNGYVSKEEYDVIKEFHFALERYEPNPNFEDKDILTDSNWLKIVELGKNTLEKLALLLTDPEEKKLVLFLENYPICGIGPFTTS